MSVESEKDLEGLRRVGAFVAAVLDEIGKSVEEGISTLDLDVLAQKLFQQAGAASAPQVVYGFPGTILISVNDEIVHGIPGPRRLKLGDVVKLDVTTELDGYIADAARTILIPPVSLRHRRLAECAESALNRALPEARSGRPLSGRRWRLRCTTTVSPSSETCSDTGPGEPFTRIQLCSTISIRVTNSSSQMAWS